MAGIVEKARPICEAVALLRKSCRQIVERRLKFEAPEPPQFVPLTGAGTFSVENVRYRTLGEASYVISGLACAIAQGAGRQCKAALSFDGAPPGTLSEMTGTLELQAGKVKLAIDYFFSQPLDPENPEFATVSGPVTLVAKGVLPVSEVRLQIELNRTGSGVLIRWPAAAKSLTLAATTNLQPPLSWQPVAVAPVVNGEFLEVRLPANAAQRYFQLQ